MPAIHLTAADLAKLGPDARQAVAETLAAHLGAPVDLGDAHAGPVAALPATPAEAPPPQRRRLRHPWAMGGLAVAVGLGLVVLCAWAWLAWPRAGIPPSTLDGPVASATAPAVEHVTAGPISGTTPATQATPQKAQASGDPSAHSTAPAQVLAAPPAQGATVCAVLRGGILAACHWQTAG